jgi:diadenosine tetraphosphatase ApaH/serine/threonine PP2A family protein phosphatase
MGASPAMARHLVLSDIHANLTALEAVLQAAGQWDDVLCLGDLVGYGPDPNEVVERVRALGARAVRGNHDRVAAGLAEPEEFNAAARMAIEWTRHQLRSQALSYLRQLPPGPVESDGLILVHGAVSDEDRYVFTPREAFEELQRSPGRVTLFGHTHVQGGFLLQGQRLGEIRVEPDPAGAAAVLELDPATRYFINPGSVGQPRDGDPRAAFAVIEDASRVAFYRVPYDIAAVQQRMAAAGLPEALILRLAFGR